MIGYDFGVGVLVGLNPIIRGKVTLDIVVNFVTRSGIMHAEAIKGTTLKPILQYRLFGIRRELTLALIRRWVPHRRAFRMGGGWFRLLCLMWHS